MLGTGWKKEETLSEEQLRLEPQAGTDRHRGQKEGQGAHSLFLPLRLEGGITPTDRHCRLLAQPGESGDRSTQASSATYGIYGPSSPLPSRWMQYRLRDCQDYLTGKQFNDLLDSTG